MALCGCALAPAAARCAPARAAAPVTADALDPVRLAIRNKDFAGARRLLDPLARGTNVDAQYLLGALLLSSPDGDPDPVAARNWLQKAAGSGDPRAAYMLSVLSATSAPIDEVAAKRWLETAAKGGLEPAIELQRKGRLPMSFLPAIDLTEADARAAAFARAAMTNDVGTLQRLAPSKAEVNAVDEFGRAALAHAAAG